MRADGGVGDCVRRRVVGLDVDDGRSVEDVDRLQMKNAGLRIERCQPNHMQPDRVRPRRGPQRKRAARRSRMAGLLYDKIARGLVEPGQDRDVARLFEAGKARTERFVHFDAGGNCAFARGGHVPRAGVPVAPGRTNATDEQDARVVCRDGRIERQFDFPFALPAHAVASVNRNVISCFACDMELVMCFVII